jgi:carbon-monoxide dehydrogenase medium subunit
MWKRYCIVTQIDEALDWLAKEREKARIIAGATDLILEMDKGTRQDVETLIDISRVSSQDTISLDTDEWIHIGPLVTHNQCASSPLLYERAYPLARACWEVGSPQIRNRGTIAGNLITASPANDTITPLMALGAILTLRSRHGERKVAIEDFYTGVRRTVLKSDEMLVDIAFPALRPSQKGIFIKYALRKAQAISIVNLAAILDLDGENRVHSAQITLGAVAPTIIHALSAEEFLLGKTLTPEVIAEAAERCMAEAKPISDVRGSARFRKKITGVIAKRALQAIVEGREKEGMPSSPITLSTRKSPSSLENPIVFEENSNIPIICNVNGQQRIFHSGHRKTLLRLLREEGLLIGTKEGCAEGECGACTVILDGMAVMSCMVPAPRAHGAEIITVEGLAENNTLHPVQEAFIEAGAVQCGYCTPGFLVSAAVLLKESPRPSRNEIVQAFSGNLCRCTGYYKIVEAVEKAVEKGG